MFKRRQERNIFGKIREALWPSMGWLRMGKYIRHRLIRLPDSTHKIALGLAIGTGVSFSPLVGTHFFQSIGLAFIARANPLAAFIGTAAGNPWTFPLIWWSGYTLGTYIFGLNGWDSVSDAPGDVTISMMWDMARSHPMDIFLPWLLGGTVMGVVIGLPSYYIYYGMIKGGRMARRKVIERKAHKVAKEVTGQKT